MMCSSDYCLKGQYFSNKSTHLVWLLMNFFLHPHWNDLLVVGIAFLATNTYWNAEQIIDNPVLYSALQRY